MQDSNLLWKKRDREDESSQKREPEPPNIETYSSRVVQFPPSSDSEPQTASELNMNWLNLVQQSSQLLMGAIEPRTFTLQYANDYLCRLSGIEAASPEIAAREIHLIDLFPELDRTAIQTLYQQQILLLVLRDLYQIKFDCIVDEPIVTALHSPLYSSPRWIEFWLRKEQLRVTRIDSQLDEFANLDLQQTPLEGLQKLLILENYRVEGLLLLEGIDITVQKTLQELTQLLIEQESILGSEKFLKVGQEMRSLFRAQSILILNAENEQARLLLNPDSEDVISTIYPLESLQGSQFLRAVEANQVWNVLDLSQDCQTDCERSLLEMGIRSLLLIPLMPNTLKVPESQTNGRRLVGLVGLASDRINHFNRCDCKHAQALSPALTTALRQAIGRRVTRIHPSVEWRFLQEIERRSWGLLPEPIIFKEVYPLYGISDIRGSSHERNRAIQADLLEQFWLGLAVVEAAYQSQPTALVQQLRLDLLDYIERLRQSIAVDAEVTAIQYLRENLEIYFDYFAQCSPEALTAVETYRTACDNDHESVYVARAQYDHMIARIDAMLLETWESWQIGMQKITSHYSDVETTDGIDHMLYAGVSIDPKFSAFHLRNLRYEQLRAVCDCARTAFRIQDEYNIPIHLTHLVLVQDITLDIIHEEKTERLFDVRGSHDTRYEIVKKRIDKACEAQTQTRITQPGMLTIVYSTDEEWAEYQQYLRYLVREGWVGTEIESGFVEPLPGVTGLKFARVRVLPAPESGTNAELALEV